MTPHTAGVAACTGNIPDRQRGGSGEPNGPARDLYRLKKHGGMSLVELRDFVRQLHGRKPITEADVEKEMQRALRR